MKETRLDIETTKILACWRLHGAILLAAIVVVTIRHSRTNARDSMWIWSAINYLDPEIAKTVQDEHDSIKGRSDKSFA